MGNTTTSFSDTLTELKHFDVFPEFPSDRSAADKLISMKATNALKNVNNSFISPSNGHSKRKRVLAIPSPINDSPVRRSRRRIQSNNAMSPIDCVSSCIIPRSPEPSPIPLNSSITRSLLTYRVLLPHDLFRICDGENLVLVVDKDSFGLKKILVVIWTTASFFSTLEFKVVARSMSLL